MSFVFVFSLLPIVQSFSKNLMFHPRYWRISDHVGACCERRSASRRRCSVHGCARCEIDIKVVATLGFLEYFYFWAPKLPSWEHFGDAASALTAAFQKLRRGYRRGYIDTWMMKQTQKHAQHHTLSQPQTRTQTRRHRRRRR